MKKHKNKILVFLVIAAVLSFAFWLGGNAPTLRGWEPNTQSELNYKSPEPEAKSDASLQQSEEKVENVTLSENADNPTNTNNPPSENLDDDRLVCTLSVRCDTIFNNLNWLEDGKADILPKDGIILAPIKAEFYEGESVFDVMLREMKKNKIHFEFVNTPVYDSVYIEGIANIYEFDCGELSGWMYKVNGSFPEYGCSKYTLKNGDVIEWMYTCDLGADIGKGDKWQSE